MEILENIDTILSVVSGIGSVIMFFLAKKEKNSARAEREECSRIRQEINQQITNNRQDSNIIGHGNSVSSETVSINRVDTFDYKSIKNR